MGAVAGRRRLPAIVLAAAALVALAVPAVRTRAAGPAPATCGPTVDVTGGEWRSYGHDYSNTRHQERERVIAHADVPFLSPAWTFSSQGAGGEGDFTGTPVVADGCLYAGSNRGWVFAMNADTGALVWKAKVPQGGGINASVAVADGTVYAAVTRTSRTEGCQGANCVGPYVVALDQSTGALKWATPPIDAQPGADVYGTPTVFDGLLFQGVSGGSAELGDETDRYAFEGNFVLLDAATGALVRKTYTIHPPGQPKDDFAGGGVWSTPAIDPQNKFAFVGTANPFKPQAEAPNVNSVIKVDLDRNRPTFGTIVGHYKGTIDEYVPGFSDAPCYDIPGNPPPYYPQGLGSCGDIDLDFGASPNLFRDAKGRLLVGAGQKSGIYHVFEAETMKPVWTSPVGPPSSVGGIVGSTAYDGASIYGPITVGGYLWSVDAATGAWRWATPVADGAHWGESVTVADGIVYTVDLKGFLDAYDGRTGVPMLHRPLLVGSSNNSSPMLSWGGVSVARNTIYAAVGISSLANGFIVALRPNATDNGSGGGDGGGGGGGGDPGPGGGSGPVILAGPGAFASTYATPVMTVTKGGALSFANVDAPQHDVTAVEKAADGSPLFRSKLVGIGEVTPVEGLDRVQSGKTYAFYCSIHPGMKGTLIVR